MLKLLKKPKQKLRLKLRTSGDVHIWKGERRGWRPWGYIATPGKLTIHDVAAMSEKLWDKQFADWWSRST